MSFLLFRSVVGDVDGVDWALLLPVVDECASETNVSAASRAR